MHRNIRVTISELWIFWNNKKNTNKLFDTKNLEEEKEVGAKKVKKQIKNGERSKEIVLNRKFITQQRLVE